MKRGDDHLCINPNTCDFCNGVNHENDEAAKIVDELGEEIDIDEIPGIGNIAPVGPGTKKRYMM